MFVLVLLGLTMFMLGFTESCKVRIGYVRFGWGLGLVKLGLTMFMLGCAESCKVRLVWGLG